ncbi:tetratricopeptide repeat-containing sensor histidine kinase [Lacinutrix undariae]
MRQLITLAAILSSFFCICQTQEIDRLTAELANKNEDSLKVDATLHLVKELFISKNYPKADLFIENAKTLSKTINYKKGTAESTYYKACIYAKKDDYKNATKYFYSAIQLYTILNDTLSIARTNNKLGSFETKNGNYKKALKHILIATRLFELKEMKDELSLSYDDLAKIYLLTNQNDKSLEYHLKALKTKQCLKDSIGLKNTSKNIANLYALQNKHEHAIIYYKNTLKLLNSITDKKLKGEILTKIGTEFMHNNDYVNAEKYLITALQYNHNQSNKIQLASTLNNIGALNINKHKLKLAKAQLNEAYTIAKSNNNNKELLYNYLLHTKIDSTEQKFQNAFFWQNKYYDLKEKLRDDGFIKNSYASHLTNHATNSAENDFLPKDVMNELKKFKYFSAVLIIIAVIAISFLIMVYIQRKNRIKYTKNLEDKNTQIETQKKHLEETNDVKDRLFSIVSHDLKDSVSSIKGFIDLLKDNNLTKDEFYELLPELSENADNASSLLYNLLNWSKTQMQNLNPRPELFNIQDVFQEKIRLIENKISKKQITLIDNSKKHYVFADKNMIGIVIQNLITNAVKFCSVEDSITISTILESENIIITIEDSGVGIAQENIDKLFKKSAFSTNGTCNEKGTGLGLTICKELIQINKGDIWVKSKENIGSQFFIKLPRKSL